METKNHELPQPERARRKTIRSAIEMHQKSINEEWAQAAPHLVRLIAEGAYREERDYRNAIDQRTEVLRQEIARLHEMLPPFLEMRKDEFLERVMLTDI